MAADSLFSMNSLKLRMQEVADELNKYKILYEKSENELQSEISKTRQLDGQVRELNRKVTHTEDDFDQQTAKYKLLTDKLEETIKVAEECDKQRRLLDIRRIQDEEKLLELEQIYRETGEFALESEKRYDEISRKLASTEVDLEKELAKTEKCELNVKNLQEDLKALTSKLKTMQNKVDKASAKEANYDKVLEDLRANLHQVESHGNKSDKTTSMLQRELDQLQDQLSQLKVQCQVLRQESDPQSRG